MVGGFVVVGGFGAPARPSSPRIAREVVDVLCQFEEVGRDREVVIWIRLGGRLWERGGFLAMGVDEWWWWWGLFFVGIVDGLDQGYAILLDARPHWVFLRAVIFGYKVGHA